MRPSYLLFFLFFIALNINLAQAQFDIMVWTGDTDSSWSEFSNWTRNGGGGGVPSPTDSIVLPGGLSNYPVIETPYFNSVGALGIRPGAFLKITGNGTLVLENTATIDSGGNLLLEGNVTSRLTIGTDLYIKKGGIFTVTNNNPTAEILGDVVVGGTFTIGAPLTPTILCRGNWIRNGGSSFSPGWSTFIFRNPAKVLTVSRGTFYNLIIDSTLGAQTQGNISITNQLTLAPTLTLREIDTLNILENDTSAIIGPGRIKYGTIRRTIDSTQAFNGGTYRFDRPRTFTRFAPIGIPPRTVTITTYPDSILSCFDSASTRRGFYDISQAGGIGFRAFLSLPFDLSGIPIFELPFYRLIRVENNCTLADTLRPYGIDTLEITEAGVELDSVDGFSRWAVIRPKETGINDNVTKSPYTFSLEQNYPNPFNPTTNLSFEIRDLSFVIVKIYDVLGQEVATLVNEKKSPGSYIAEWYAGNRPSGVYFYRLSAVPLQGTGSGFLTTKKMILLK